MQIKELKKKRYKQNPFFNLALKLTCILFISSYSLKGLGQASRQASRDLKEYLEMDVGSLGQTKNEDIRLCELALGFNRDNWQQISENQETFKTANIGSVYDRFKKNEPKDTQKENLDLFAELVQLQVRCLGLSALSQNSHGAEKAIYKSHDEKIKCINADFLTQNYGSCKSLGITHDATFATNTLTETGFQVNETMAQAEGQARVQNEGLTNPTVHLDESKKLLERQATKTATKATISAAAAAAYGVNVYQYVTMDTLLDQCQSSFNENKNFKKNFVGSVNDALNKILSADNVDIENSPALRPQNSSFQPAIDKIKKSIADLSPNENNYPDVCLKSALAYEGKLINLNNAKQRDTAQTLLAQATASGLVEGAKSLAASQSAENLKRQIDYLNGLKQDNENGINQDLFVEECQVNPTLPKCQNLDGVNNQVTIEDGGLGINFDTSRNHFDQNALDLKDASNNNAFGENLAKNQIRGLNNRLKETSSKPTLSGIPSAASISSKKKKSPGSGSGGGGLVSSGGKDESAKGKSKNDDQVLAASKSNIQYKNSGNKNGFRSASSSGGSSKDDSVNPFAKLFNKNKQNPTVLNGRNIASSLHPDSDSIFKRISKSYTKAVKQNRLEMK